MLSFSAVLFLLIMAIIMVLAIVILNVVTAGSVINAYNSGDDDYKSTYHDVYIGAIISLVINLLFTVGLIGVLGAIYTGIERNYSMMKGAYLASTGQEPGGGTSQAVKDWRMVMTLGARDPNMLLKPTPEMVDLVRRVWPQVQPKAYTALNAPAVRTAIKNPHPSTAEIKQAMQTLQRV